jgi:hypothetical protein
VIYSNLQNILHQKYSCSVRTFLFFLQNSIFCWFVFKILDLTAGTKSLYHCSMLVVIWCILHEVCWVGTPPVRFIHEFIHPEGVVKSGQGSFLYRNRGLRIQWWCLFPSSYKRTHFELKKSTKMALAPKLMGETKKAIWKKSS